MLTRMIFSDASSYSKRTYARFRSSMALERFMVSPHASSRSASLRWARAWQLVVQFPERNKQLSPLTPSVGVKNSPLNLNSGQISLAREDSLN